MPVDRALLELMPHILGWRAKVGQDVYQNPIWSTEMRDVRGLKVDEEHEVEDSNGVKQIAAGTVYLADVYGVRSSDYLEWNGVQIGKIIRVESFDDNNGPYAQVVHFG